MSKKEHYDNGDILCDMHDGFKYLPDNLEVVSHVELRTNIASNIVSTLNHGKHPGNKYLVVVGFDPSYAHIVAAYSYDNMTLGMVELKYKEVSGG